MQKMQTTGQEGVDRIMIFSVIPNFISNHF